MPFPVSRHTILLFLAFLTLTSTHPSTLLSRGSTPGVYVCKYADWLGPCTWTAEGDSKCRILPYIDEASYQQSFGPDQGLKCTFWATKQCSKVEVGTGQATLTYPGNTNPAELAKDKPGVEKGKGFLSYMCSRT
jgi:hypothetical protein